MGCPGLGSSRPSAPALPHSAGELPAAWDFSQHSTYTELFEVHGVSRGFWM